MQREPLFGRLSSVGRRIEAWMRSIYQKTLRHARDDIVIIDRRRAAIRTMARNGSVIIPSNRATVSTAL